MAKLASIRTISKLKPIANADAIEAAVIDGWEVVVKKGEFKEHELCVFFEIDSFLPMIPQFEFLKNTKKMNGVEGYRLRTIRLRGQLSQGLALPLSDFSLGDILTPGDDVTELLGVLKYEKPIPPALAAQARGHFPPFLKKTDEERIQNISPYELQAMADVPFYQTLKRDGSSLTIYCRNADPEHDPEESVMLGYMLGVCSRNIDLKPTEGNKFWGAARNTGLDVILPILCHERGQQLAIQGELYGEGIQGNPHKIAGLNFEIFNIWDIDNKKYLPPDAVFGIIGQLKERGANVNYVPHNEVPAPLRFYGLTAAELLTKADAAYKDPDGSFNEGHAYKSAVEVDGKIVSFKVVSNHYLLDVEE